MSLSINHNRPVFTIQRYLSTAANSMTTALNRMSTGYKINNSGDDAAGSYIAGNLTSQINGLKQALKNINTGITLLNTADSTLDNLSNILYRLRDLAVQASNGVYDNASKKAMQNEADALINEMYRIKNNTTFNGLNLFGGIETAPVVTKSRFTAISPENIPTGYTAVYTLEDLNQVRNNLSGKYILMNDIDLSSVSFWVGIGDDTNKFNGIFDGNGYKIKNMKITDGQNSCGLFTYTDSNAVIKNVSLVNVDINISEGGVGGLVGANRGEISNCSVSGNISAEDFIGGIAGLSSGTITNCSSTANITSGNNAAGGISGLNLGNISNSYATGNIFARGTSAGGLAGGNMGTINNCYSTGNVEGGETIGGFCGVNGGKINASYTTSKVKGRLQVGAFVGENQSSITNSLWNIDTAGTISTAGRDSGNIQDTFGLTSEEMNDKNYYIGWDNSVWDFSTYPPTLNLDIETNGTRLQIGSNAHKSNALYYNLNFNLGSFKLDFSTIISSTQSLNRIDEMINSISSKRSDIGAALNQMESVVQSQTISIENFTAAKSTIMDADMAEESANFIRNQILQQTGSALLVHAQSSQSNLIYKLIK